jgi:histidine ammonia-lyase
MATSEPVLVSGHGLSIEEVVQVARDFRPVALEPGARRRVELAREVVDHLVERGVKVYGITTGFASLRSVTISQPEELSRRLIVSHATAVGRPFDEDVVRAAMLLRAHTLARGCSGVRPQVVDMLLGFLNAGIYPFVPCQGSCGSSGDLASLSHMALTMIAVDQLAQGRTGVDGQGEPGGLLYQAGPGRTEPVRDSRESDFAPAQRVADEVRARLPDHLRAIWPLRLTAKEGLALNNGAVFCTAMLALAVADSENLIGASERITALGFEAMQAVPDCLDPGITALRPHPGHVASAGRIREALEGSDLVPVGGSLGLNMARLNRVSLGLKDLEEACTAAQAERGAHNAPADAEGGAPSEAALIARAAADLREITRRVYPDLWQSLGRHRADAAKDPASYPKQQEITACNRTLAGCLRAWAERLGALPPGLTGGPWYERLRSLYTELRAVVPESPETQDNYSFRAAPTVLGAARDTAAHARRIAEVDINSATDNPLIVLDEILAAAGLHAHDPNARVRLREWLAGGGWRVAAGAVRSAANFHGQPIGTAADQLKLAMAEVGNIAERRIACLTDKAHSKGLPPYLVWRPGLNSGFMIPQYSAASLVAENRAIGFPASMDSVPTGEGSEDHNAMATTACRYCREVIENVVQILAIEALCAYQGVQFRKPARLGRLTGALESLLAGELGASIYPAAHRCRAALTGWGLPAEAVDGVRPCYLDDQSHREGITLVAGLLRRGQLAAD